MDTGADDIRFLCLPQIWGFIINLYWIIDKQKLMMFTTRTFIFLVVLLLLGACQSQPDLSQPPEIVYGEDVCTECGMIISEARFASAYYTQDGEARRFDDIGGMLTHHVESQEDVAQFWVHDYETEVWIVAEEAFYVSSEELHTPMGFGVVAFSDQVRAQNFAGQSQAMVMSFDGLMDQYMNGDDTHEHSDS